MFVPPDQRRPAYPPQPAEERMSRRGGAVLLWVIGLLLLSIFLAPIGGGSVLQALMALCRR